MTLQCTLCCTRAVSSKKCISRARVCFVCAQSVMRSGSRRVRRWGAGGGRASATGSSTGGRARNGAVEATVDCGFAGRAAGPQAEPLADRGAPHLPAAAPARPCRGRSRPAVARPRLRQTAAQAAARIPVGAQGHPRGPPGHRHRLRRGLPRHFRR
jgi:hypothetical protein